MNDKKPAFVDTNILVYAFDRTEKQRRKIAANLVEQLASTNRLCLSTQVLQEFFVTVTRKIARPIAAERALEILDDFASWPLLVVDFGAIREAGRLCKRLHLSFWDTLILVAANRSNSEILYTEDLNHNQIIHGVRVLNPFVVPKAQAPAT